MASTTTPATSDGGTDRAGVAGAVRTKDLLERADGGFAELVPAAWSLATSVLEAQAPAGWTYKEIVAHIAAWERITAARLERFRESGAPQPPPGHEDDLNALVAREAGARTAAEILAELAAAHAALVSEIGTLDDAAVAAHEGWAAAVVAANTFDHYAEHLPELLAATPKTPAALSEAMREEWRPFRIGLGRIGDRHLADATPAGWTYKALVGHATYWLEALLPEIEVRLAGRRSAPEDVDAANARAAADADARTSHEVLERLDRAFGAVVERVKALPEEVPFLAVRAVAGETYAHFRAHRPEIEAGALRTVADVLARNDEIWRVLRAAIRDLGRAGLASRLRGEWRYQDEVAHIIGWMQQAVRELRARQYRTDWTREGVDAFNERSVSDRRLMGPEALLDELDTTYRLLVDELGRLTDAEVAAAGGPTTFFAWRHWEEHLADFLGAAPRPERQASG
ncbi:MAG TPA: DinB family protein [Candidatus Limnocylindria bacterium]|nr:DinB family protein [Candidatus Limnocylindria bacterium]